MVNGHLSSQACCHFKYLLEWYNLIFCRDKAIDCIGYWLTHGLLMVQELLVAGWMCSFYIRQLYESFFTNRVAGGHPFDEVSVLLANAYFPFY